ncbi:MAG TPA: guanylate kinase [Stellaceae bacterium]|nr:guanylate kinase [Stellaceae bacterium]
MTEDLSISRRGFMLVLSSPSGAGKTTLTRRLLEIDESLRISVSVTTRPRRPNEIDGRDYVFIDQPRFDRMVEKGDLLEHATVFGNCYGTPRALVEETLAGGRDVVSDLDWQGTQQLAQSFRDDMVSVFILPPSVAELHRRLTQRNQDSAEVVAARMAKAVDEMSHWAEYDYVIVNQDLDRSIATLQAILAAERSRRVRQVGLFEFVRRLSQRG